MDSNNELMDALCSSIKENMEKFNIKSLRELEGQTEISDSTLAHIMKGETKDILFSHVVKLAHGFSLTPSQFLDTEAFNNIELKDKKPDNTDF